MKELNKTEENFMEVLIHLGLTYEECSATMAIIEEHPILMIDIYELLKRKNLETITHQQAMNIIGKVVRENKKMIRSNF